MVVMKKKTPQWRRSLQRGKQFKPRKRAECYEVRKRAFKAMEDLTFILQEIKVNASDPGKEFSLIFKDEQRYFRMIRACKDAYDESFKSRMRLFRPEDLDLVQTACAFAGIEIHSKRQLSDRHFRQKILEQLKKTPYPRQEIRDQLDKDNLQYEDEATCFDYLIRRQQERHPGPI